MDNKKRVLITGCSSGFGFLTAVEFANCGYHVFATMRNPDSPGGKKLNELAKQAGWDLTVTKLDVKDASDVKNLADLIGPNTIDVLVNNAAYGYISEIENIDINKYIDQMETNIFSALNLIKQFAPGMKAKKFGRIINVGSILSFINIPKYGPYSSTKHALESLSLTADMELSAHNVRSIMADPGSFPTNFSDNKIDNQTVTTNKSFDYEKLVNSSATRVSKLILKIAESKNPKPRYVIGNDALLGAILIRILPVNIFYKLLSIYTTNFKRD